MAWSIGANDVANAMGTSVGSRALTINQAILIAAIFEFLGAFLVGDHVTSTIKQGIVDPAFFAADPLDFAKGMTIALLVTAAWLSVASFHGMPVSTTHSIIGAVIGFGLVAQGPEAIIWWRIGSIIISWCISPLMGGCIAFFSFWIIRRYVLDATDPIAAARRWVPALLFVVSGALLSIFVPQILEKLQLGSNTLLNISAVMFCDLLIVFTAMFFLARIRKTYTPRGESLAKVERIFAYMQCMTACFMAMAHGSNDVANAIGPVAGVIGVLKNGSLVGSSPVPLWLLGMGGVGIIIGLATYGRRVIHTVGTQITEITPTRGFAAEFGSSSTILIGSILGLPLSTTQVLVGAVIGVGMARGVAGLNLAIIKKIMTSWVITIPATVVVTAIITWFVEAFIF